jgi:hypothetical protein
MGPMEGHEPLIPKDYVHYDLHMWLFKPNPLGLFSATNPVASCDAAQGGPSEQLLWAKVSPPPG